MTFAVAGFESPRESATKRPPRETANSKVTWDALIPHLVNPIKVAIIEALLWIGQPMSPTALAASFDGEVDLPAVAYHARTLAKLGLLERTGERRARGTRQALYYFAPEA